MKELENEFITKHREYKPPYTLNTRSDGTKVITIDRKRKLSPADKEEIEMLVKVGYIPVRKKADISKSDMIKYVKENYDQKEQELLNKKLDTINLINEETGKLITFATIKSWFKDRYIYYPKGVNYNFGNTKSAQEKQERFKKVFNEHKNKLSADSRAKETLNAPKEDTHQEPPQYTSNNNKNKNHN